MPKKGKKKKAKAEGAPEEEDDDDYPDLDIRPERWVNLRVWRGAPVPLRRAGRCRALRRRESRDACLRSIGP